MNHLGFLTILTLIYIITAASIENSTIEVYQCPKASRIFPLAVGFGIPLIELFNAFDQFRAGNITKETLKSTIENSITKLERGRPSFESKVSAIDPELFHKRYDATMALVTLDQVILQHRTVLSRLDEYDQHRNASSFDVAPIKASLDLIEKNFTNTAKQRFGGCEQWSEALEAAWPRRAEIFYDLRENLRILAKAAQKMASEVDKLAQQKPPGFESYFSIETEYKLAMMKMLSVKLQELFEEFHQRLTPPPAPSSANLAF